MQHPGQHFRISIFQCFVDGSWSELGKAGIGIYLTKDGEVIEWMVVIWCSNMQMGVGTVVSDSKETVDAVSEDLPVFEAQSKAIRVLEKWDLFTSIWSPIESNSCFEEMPNINVVEAQTVLEGYKLLQKQANGVGIVLSDFQRDYTVTGTWISEYIGLEGLWGNMAHWEKYKGSMLVSYATHSAMHMKRVSEQLMYW